MSLTPNKCGFAPMTKEEFRAWRERFGLTQGDVAARYNLSRNTIQNWETGVTALPSTVEGACVVWEDRLKKELAALGPVTLIYSDAPMFIDPYRPPGDGDVEAGAVSDERRGVGTGDGSVGHRRVSRAVYHREVRRAGFNRVELMA